MTLHPIARRAVLGFALLLLLLLAWTGLSGGVSQWPQPVTTGQFVQTAFQFVYGLFALLSVITTFWMRRWNRFAVVGSEAGLAIAGGLAPATWGGASVWIGLLAGAASLGIALLIVWMLRVGTRAAT